MLLVLLRHSINSRICDEVNSSEGFKFSTMATDLTTADVYEEASLIGQDFEKIIERFGHDAVIDLMPKIIRVLERLEVVVGQKDKARLEIDELKLENERLYLEIQREASQRRQLDEELYQVSATGETDNLKSMLLKLQEENQKLRLEYEGCANSQPATAYISAPGDAELMQKMKDAIDNQRDSIRSKNAEIETLRNDLEAMEEQIQRLTTINESLRKTLSASQARVSTLAKEKAELQTELRSVNRTKLPSVLQVQENQEENIDDADLINSDHEEGVEVEDEKIQDKMDELSETAVDVSKGVPPPKPPRLKNELDVEQNGDGLTGNESAVSDQDKDETQDDLNRNGPDEKDEHGDWELIGEASKTAFDAKKSIERKEKVGGNQLQTEMDKKKDPNRPRYTKAEMLEVLIERNNLKEQVFALKDELRIYKPSYGDEDQPSPYSKHTTSPRRLSRKEESGISRIFSIFSHHRD